MLVYTRPLLFLSCLATIGLSPARGQVSVPPLPALPVTFVFSNCDAGVTYRATILDWGRDLDGKINSATKVVQPNAVSYQYSFFGSFSMTIGQTTQFAVGIPLPDGSISRPLGGLSILYTNLGVSGNPFSTTFSLNSPNANGGPLLAVRRGVPQQTLLPVAFTRCRGYGNRFSERSLCRWLKRPAKSRPKNGAEESAKCRKTSSPHMKPEERHQERQEFRNDPHD